MTLAASTYGVEVLGKLISQLSPTGSLVSSATDSYSMHELLNSATNFVDSVGLILASTSTEGIMSELYSRICLL